MVPLRQLFDVLRPQTGGVPASCIECQWIEILERVQSYSANDRDDVDPGPKGNT